MIRGHCCHALGGGHAPRAAWLLRARSQAEARSGPRSAMQPLRPGPQSDWRKDQLGEDDDEAYLELSADEVEDRLDEAAALVSVVQDLRPVNAKVPASERRFNACAEIWRCVRRVPPWERHRLLDELDPGSIRSLWKASMSRYVLTDARTLDLAQGYSIWQDFPDVPGQVFTYVGKCEKYVMAEPQVRFFSDETARGRGSKPVTTLRPSFSPIGAPTGTDRKFKIYFFVHPPSGELMGRFAFPFLGPLDRWWDPCYLRLKLGLALTPMKADAGADMTFEYPFQTPPDFNGWLGCDTELHPADLTDPSWPLPDVSVCGSPLSLGPRDYVRVAGPGLLVGCAYSSSAVSDDDCVYFALARRSTRAEFAAALEQQQDSRDGDDEPP